MAWEVVLSKKAERSLAFLPKQVVKNLTFLMQEMELRGPVRGDWHNYSKLSPGRHHCHLKKGHATYVAVWEERDRKIRLIEVTYVGTHEKAPY